MARPRAEDQHRKSINFTIRLTSGELQKLKAAADLCSLSPSALIREKVFGGKFPKPRLSQIDLGTYLELKKAGVNLNQLTKLAHSGRIGMELLKILMQLHWQQELIIRKLLYHAGQPEDR
jgi:Bacterial mobilisation protein (MobC)